MIVLPATGWAADKAENHCHNTETNQRWEELAADNPESDPIQRFYPLRVGLCLRVGRGTLTIPRATTIFGG